MLLKEFFHRPNVDTPASDKDAVKDELKKDVMGCILDDDDLYKKYYAPVNEKIEKLFTEGDYKKTAYKYFKPWVEEGCEKYYDEKELKGYIEDHFDKDLMKDLTEKLIEVYYDYFNKEESNNENN